MQHSTDDTLERFAMRTLPDAVCATLEVHLLICPECQDRLQATDEYLAAIRAAAAKLKASEEAE